MTPEQYKVLEEKIAFLERRVNEMELAPTVTPDFTQTIKGIVGTMSIGDLADVSISGVSDAEVLKYNSSDGKWENGTDDIGAM